MAESNGRWVTINGAHVFIEKGQSVNDALDGLSKGKRGKKRISNGKHEYSVDEGKSWFEMGADAYGEYDADPDDFDRNTDDDFGFDEEEEPGELERMVDEGVDVNDRDQVVGFYVDAYGMDREEAERRADAFMGKGEGIEDEEEEYTFEDEVNDIMERLENESGDFYDARSFAEQRLKDYDPKAKEEALRRFAEKNKKENPFGDREIPYTAGEIEDEEIEKYKAESEEAGKNPADGGQSDRILGELKETFGDGATVDEKGRYYLKGKEGEKPVALTADDEMPKGSVVKIMPEWLDKGENPDRVYFVAEDRGNNLLVWTPNKDSIAGRHEYTWPKKTMYSPEATAKSEKNPTGTENANGQTGYKPKKDYGIYGEVLEGDDRKHMEDLAKAFTDAGLKTSVGESWQDYGAGIKWTSPVSNNTQLLTPREWGDYMSGRVTANELIEKKKKDSYWSKYFENSSTEPGQSEKPNSMFDYMKKLYDDPNTRDSAIRKAVENFPDMSYKEIGEAVQKLIAYAKQGKKK